MIPVFKDPRKQAYLNPAGTDKPLRSPLPDSVLEAARRYRLSRLREQLVRHDCAAILLYDPINIRYALDVANMQLWTLHNAVRYALVFAEGPAVLFEFKEAKHLGTAVSIVDEVRPAVSWIYMSAAQHQAERVTVWAAEIDDLLHDYSGGNRRLAIDKVEPPGLKALEKLGISCVEGQELTERARSIKSEDELELMRWTVRVCEAGLARMYECSLPGRTEQQIWAELHYENIRSGGEWLETRLCTAGPHTNPWYSECSDYVCQDGDIISVDTDLIGPYGYCADISRSWVCGHHKLNSEQRTLYAAALQQIDHNLELIRPGLGFLEFNDQSWRIPERYVERRYTVALHGVGLCDEWPAIPTHPDVDYAYDGVFEENMVLCVESLIGAEGTECIKLETQVVVKPGGVERLDSFPWEEL